MTTCRRICLAVLAASMLVACSAPNSDWGATWIGAPWEGERFDQDNAGPAPIFKKEFRVNGHLDSAKIKICGLGLFELRVNGAKVSEDVLVPNESLYSYRDGFSEDPIVPVNGKNFSNYRVYYLEYDLEDYLKEGDNEMTVLLGNGFFSTDSRRYVKSYGTPRLICRADLVYSNGRKKSIVSDLSWRVSKSPLVMNDIFNGEIYDARLEGQEDWLKPVPRKAPDGKLERQMAPSDRIMETLSPQSIVKLDNGDWEVDFGDYITGWVRFLNIHSVPRGYTIEVIYPLAEYGNGVQKYIARGEQNDEAYAPRFTWYTFRKVRIRGMEKTLKPSHLCAEAVYSNVRTTGNFECSNPLINRVQHLYWRAQTDNMHMGVPTDCPHRERGPYTGDGQVACVTAMHTFDMNLFYRKWIRDMADCQDKETGYVPNGAPWHPGCGGGVPWGAAMNIVPWEHYLHYGDISVLAENYAAMKAQLRHMISWRREDGTMLQRFVNADGKPLKWLNLGEWSPVAELPDDALVHTYYLWKCAVNTAKAAKALGVVEDYHYYTSLAQDVFNAFHRAFYNPQTHSYGHNDGAEIPSADNTGNRPGVVKVYQNNGIRLDGNGRLITYRAVETQIKAGTNTERPIAPNEQHMSAFYGLAKAAGDTTQSASSNPVGQYTDDAKIAIQKMLGIYEAPWELIAEDTFTNETEADYIINIDRYGAAFELTDVLLVLAVPNHAEDTIIADYGRVYLYDGNTNVKTIYLLNAQSKTITAGSGENTGICLLTQEGSLVYTELYQWAIRTTRSNRQIVYADNEGSTGAGNAISLFVTPLRITSLRIGKITGLMRYRLYGKRKWQ